MSISQRLRSATPSVGWSSSHPTGSFTPPSTALCRLGSSIRRYLPTPPKRSSHSGASSATREAVAFWFDFAWVLADGTSAPFTIVDIAELTEDGLIANLHIIYDTSPIRGDFEQATHTRKP
jgi:hypothetical protein